MNRLSAAYVFIFSLIWLAAGTFAHSQQGDGGAQGGGGADASQPYRPGMAAAGSTALPGNYVIQPMDIFRVSVFQEPDLEKEVRVSQDGTVHLPLIGTVKVAGLSIYDAQQYIRKLYNENFLVEPHITLTMLAYTERLVHIHGQVNRPGTILIPPEQQMMLSQAISAAGGLSRLASGRVQIKREDEEGRARVMDINFTQILRDPNARDVPVEAGDNIYVVERIF